MKRKENKKGLLVEEDNYEGKIILREKKGKEEGRDEGQEKIIMKG